MKFYKKEQWIKWEMNHNLGTWFNNETAGLKNDLARSIGVTLIVKKWNFITKVEKETFGLKDHLETLSLIFVRTFAKERIVLTESREFAIIARCKGVWPSWKNLQSNSIFIINK